LGYRLVGLLTYDSVFGGVTLQLRVVWAHDVDGITPDSGGAFIAGRQTFHVGLGGNMSTNGRWISATPSFSVEARSIQLPLIQVSLL
jgi:uncharacterized protein with beta-barrel porin domain